MQKIIKRRAWLNKVRNMRKYLYSAGDMNPIERNFKGSIIFSPHPDDETIGCGGLIAKFSATVEVVFLTRGESGIPDLGKKETSSVRFSELTSVMKYFGVSRSTQLDYPDGRLRETKGLLTGLDLNSFDHILIPSIFEHHPDHQAVAWEILELFRTKKLDKSKVIYMYEVWTPLPIFNWYLNISDVALKKEIALSKYESQIKCAPYLKKTAALNEFRGLQCGCDHAEVFLGVSYDDLKVLLNGK